MRNPQSKIEAVGGLLGTILFVLVVMYEVVLIFGTHEYMKAIAIAAVGVYCEQWNKRISER